MTNWLTREMKDNVAVVTMGRDKDNRFSGPFVDALRKELAELAQDDTVRAVVITGNDKFFSNGLDLDWMKTQGPRELFGFLMNISGFLKDTVLFPKPLIGAISGHAFGMGAIWSSGFDYRYVRLDRGWVCFPEMDINIPFSPGMIAICEHGLGKPVFRTMGFSSTRYAGAEAVDVGWAHGAVEADKLLPTALETASKMAKKGADAFRLTKEFWAADVVNIMETRDADAYKRIPLKL